jgi:hypothetical protein
MRDGFPVLRQCFPLPPLSHARCSAPARCNPLARSCALTLTLPHPCPSVLICIHAMLSPRSSVPLLNRVHPIPSLLSPCPSAADPATGSAPDTTTGNPRPSHTHAHTHTHTHQHGSPICHVQARRRIHEGEQRPRRHLHWQLRSHRHCRVRPAVHLFAHEAGIGSVVFPVKINHGPTQPSEPGAQGTGTDACHTGHSGHTAGTAYPSPRGGFFSSKLRRPDCERGSATAAKTQPA